MKTPTIQKRVKKSVKLNRGDIGNIITALGLAIELYEMNQRSLLPVNPRFYEPKDHENAAEWRDSIRIFRSLRKKLSTLEK